jgi:MFS family permease
LFIATFLFGAGWGMFIAVTPALAQDSVPPAVSGTVVGIIYALFNIGAVFGGLIVGGLIPLGFITAVLLGISLPALLSFILTFSTKKVKININK